MDFGELSNDTELRTKVTNITDSLAQIESTIDATVEFANYEDLSTEEKVKYDLYLSYAVNSLYWTYCKLQGIDVNTVRTAGISSEREHNLVLDDDNIADDPCV